MNTVVAQEAAPDAGPTSEGRLYSVVLQFAAEGGVVPATNGHQAHGLFLQLITAVDSTLAATLHKPNGGRPFTLSALHSVGRWAARPGYRVLAPAASCWLRFTALDEQVWCQAMAGLQAAPGGRLVVRYGSTDLRLIGARSTSSVSDEGDPTTLWAQHTTWTTLGAPLVAWSERLRTTPPMPWISITLQFHAPTAFSVGAGGREGVGRGAVECAVLPEPDLVFGSLARRWAQYSPIPLLCAGDVLKEAIRARVRISRYDTHTEMLQFPKHKQVGFVGRCTYTIRGDDPLAPLLETLAGFAFYSGVGMHSTHGMGQVRRVPDRQEYP